MNVHVLAPVMLRTRDTCLRRVDVDIAVDVYKSIDTQRDGDALSFMQEKMCVLE